jgi:hypothetical protein
LTEEEAKKYENFESDASSDTAEEEADAAADGAGGDAVGAGGGVHLRHQSAPAVSTGHRKSKTARLSAIPKFKGIAGAGGGSGASGGASPAVSPLLPRKSVSAMANMMPRRAASTTDGEVSKSLLALKVELAHPRKQKGPIIDGDGSGASKRKQSSTICFDFIKNGSCLRGEDCKYAHIAASASRGGVDAANKNRITGLMIPEAAQAQLDG